MVCAFSLLWLAVEKPSPGETLTPPQGVRVKISTAVVHISSGGAEPRAITHAAGPFFLYITSREQRTNDLNVEIVPAVPIPDPSKLLQIVDATSLSGRQRSAGLVDLPPGEYYLQSAASHQTLCTITIKAGL